MASPWGKRHRLGVESAEADAARREKRVRPGKERRVARTREREARAREKEGAARAYLPQIHLTRAVSPVERGREREARGGEKSAVAHLKSGGGPAAPETLSPRPTSHPRP
jgi:hypothetical protein